MFQQDWVMRQIEMAVQFVLRLLFGRDTLDNDFVLETYSGADGELLRTLDSLLTAHKINEAEDLLFQYLSPGAVDILRVALIFYDRLNAMTDAALEAAHFSRDEIREGLQDAVTACGLDLDGWFSEE